MAKRGHVRHGFATVRPYIYGPYELPEFLVTVFGAREIERHEAPDRRAAHVELAIGDGALVVEAGEMPPTVTRQKRQSTCTSRMWMARTGAPWMRARRRSRSPRTSRTASGAAGSGLAGTLGGWRPTWGNVSRFARFVARLWLCPVKDLLAGLPDFAPSVELAGGYPVTGIVAFMQPKEFRLRHFEESGAVAGFDVRFDPSGNPVSG